MDDRETAENLKRFLSQKAEVIKSKKVTNTNPIFRENSILDEDESDLEKLNKEFEDFDEDLSEITPKSSKGEFDEFKLSPKKFYEKNKKTPSMENPLKKYFRKPGISIKLPTMGLFNNEEDIDFSVNGEVTIYPLTAKDEVWLRNPDALLNGSAVEKVIESCCPAIKNVRKMPINDITALLVAIRNCSYGSEMKMSATCPHCGKKNNFVIDLDILLGNMTFFNEKPSMEIDNLLIHFEPIKYENMVYFEILMFEEAKVLQTLRNEDMEEEKKKEIIKDAVNKIAEIGIYLLCNGISKISTPEGEVDNKDFIYEFLVNSPSSVYKEIQTRFETISQIGVPTKWEAKCKGCKKTYEVEVKYDPANFFGIIS